MAMLLVALPARAHTYVHPENGPKTSRAGATEVYRLQVQVERGVPTVKVRLVVPEGVFVSRFFPAPGWVRALERDRTGRPTTITWTGHLLAGELIRFCFQAGNPPSPGALSRKVYQTDEDGVEVAWDDHAAAHPALRTEVTP